MGRKSTEKKRYVDADIRCLYSIKLLVFFQENGIKGFSMSELASNFNVSKTTLYNHFPSKKHMIEAALEYKLSTISDYKTVLFNKDLNYTERLRKTLLFYCVQIFQLSRKLLIQIEESYPDIWKKVLLFQKNVIRDLEQYYQLGQRIGHYRKDVDPVLLTMNDSLFFELLSKGGGQKKYSNDLVNLINNYCDIKFSGIKNQ